MTRMTSLEWKNARKTRPGTYASANGPTRLLPRPSMLRILLQYTDGGTATTVSEIRW